MISKKRPTIFLWPSWLASIISGDDSCVWKYYFKSHYILAEKDSDFDSNAWMIKHTKALNDLNDLLKSKGHKTVLEKEFEFPLCRLDDKYGSLVLKGRTDLISSQGNNELRIWDVKTGKRKNSHFSQVHIYMLTHLMSPKAKGWKIKGGIYYKADDIVEVNDLPDNFEETFKYYIDSVLDEDKATRVPSTYECRNCDITNLDCPFKKTNEDLFDIFSEWD